MVKRFSKNYGNKGINYLQSESLPQEQAAKTDMLSVVSIQVFRQLRRVLQCPHETGKVLHLLDRKEMAYTREIPLPKANYRPLSVLCLN